MGTKERVEILNKSDNVINELLNRVSNLEFEVEKLEKNEQYKYINGQAYFRQDYVLGREKEIERLNNKNEELLTLYTTEREVKEDYKSIIKEVREYAKEMQVYCIEFDSWGVPSKELLEILDKENKE